MSSFKMPVVRTRLSPKPTRKTRRSVTGMMSPLAQKKRSSPRSSEKGACPRRRLGCGTENRRRRRRQGMVMTTTVDECQEFQEDINSLIHWLSTTFDHTEQWKVPASNTLSIRIQLEKYLAFAMELQTHHHQKDNIILRGQDLIQTFPQLQPSLSKTLELVEMQYQRLEERLDTQYNQLEEVLLSLATSTKTDTQCLGSFDAEMIADSIDQMSFRLQNSKQHVSMMEGRHVSTTCQRSDTSTFNTNNKLSSTGGSDSSCSSSPDFDVLYEELTDWLSELHMAVTDGQRSQSNQRREQLFKGYTQELQLREVSRSKLTKKAQRLLTCRPSTSTDVTTKLQSLNQQWTDLQARLDTTAPSQYVRGSQASQQAGSATPAIVSTEEIMTVTLEVEEVIVQLKVWLTEMERQLFAADSLKCPGSMEQLERRLESHQEICADIEKNSEGIQVVLNLCTILQKDKHACTSEKERESLQLAAFNLERRWQAIQAQSMALECSIEEKLRTFKGYSAVADQTGQGEAACAQPLLDVENNLILKNNRRSYRPSGAKDDTALYTLRNNIDYDDILLVREAFSENDAFSISDTSEVSLGDFAFDDILQLKEEEEEVAVAIPSETPDIMDMSDEMIDAYLQMEDENQLLQDEEDAANTADLNCCILPDVADIHGRSNSELEFWSMSPREDLPMLSTSVELPYVFSQDDLDQEPVLLQEGSQRRSFIIDGSCSPTRDYGPITLGKYSSGTVDFMSSAVEDALESLCSEDDSDDEDEDDHEYGVHEADDEEDVDITLTEERCKNKPPPDDVVTGHLVFDIDDLDEPSVFPPTPPRKPSHGMSRSLPLTYRSSEYKVPTHDYPASYPSQPASNTWSHPSVTIAKSPLQKKGFFPTHAGCLLPNTFDDVLISSSPVKQEKPHPTNPSAEFRRLRRHLSQVSDPLLSNEEALKLQKAKAEPSQPKADNLLQVTDLSLSHMYESLDFATELTHSLMPGACLSLDTGRESPLEFPLLETDKDLSESGSVSQSGSFSESDQEEDLSDDLVQDWINKNMPSPPKLVPLELPAGLSSHPLYSMSNAHSLHDIPTHDLPCLPNCAHREIELEQEVPRSLFTSTCDPETFCVQDIDGILGDRSMESEATKPQREDITNEEVTLSLVLQPEAVTHNHTTIVHVPSNELSHSHDADGNRSTVEGSRTLNLIKERLKQEIMEQQSNKKQAHFTFVPQLGESGSVHAELGQLLGDYSHQKCYLWSIGGSGATEPVDDKDVAADEISDVWGDSTSQSSENTDKLLEASSSLVKELERGSLIEADRLAEDKIGSWRDVIILWLNEQNNTHESDASTGETKPEIGDQPDAGKDNCNKTPVDSSDSVLPDAKKCAWLDTTDEGVVPDSSLFKETGCCDVARPVWSSPCTEMMDSGNFSANDSFDDTMCELKDIHPSHLTTSTPKTQFKSIVDSNLNETIPTSMVHPTRNIPPASTNYLSPTPSSYSSRVLCAALPIFICLFFAVLVILLLPAVIVSTTGECSLSLTDNILLHSPSWEPLLQYVRGPPPQ